jgi:hypothetical protein
MNNGVKGLKGNTMANIYVCYFEGNDDILATSEPKAVFAVETDAVDWVLDNSNNQTSIMQPTYVVLPLIT